MSYKNAIEAGVAFSFLLSACRTVDASKPIDIASPGPTSAPLVEATPTNVILSGETIASTLKGSNISVEIGNMLSSELERIYPGMDEALSSEMRAWEYTRIEMRGDKQDAIFPGDDYVIGVDSVTGRGNMMFIEDSTGVWSLPRAGYQLKQGQVYRSIPMEYVSGANRNAEWRVQSGMSVLVRDRGRWNLALLALDPNTNRQILVPLNVIGGGGKSLFNVLMGTQEPYSGAEVTVNGEAGTIEVGGQVINTPAETKPAPTEGAVDAEILATLPKDYQIIPGDKIVSADGETLYKFVPEADRVNPESEWQRMITFTLEGGDKMEMAWFETAEDTYNFMLKNDILWKETWGTKDLENTQEKIDFIENFFKIPEIDCKIMMGVFPYNKDNSFKTHIMVYSAGDGTVVVFLTDEDNLQAIYVDENAPTVIAGMHL